MCTLAFYFQHFSEFPIVVAANRDEHFERPSGPPQLLIEGPGIVGGKDLLAGGTWLGVNKSGMLVGIVNRRSASAPEGKDFKSRGLLCLELLKTRNSEEAMEKVQKEKAAAYRPFNLLFTDSANAFVVFNTEHDIRHIELKPGLHVLSNTSIYDSPTGKAGHAQDMFTNSINGIDEGERSTFVGVFKRILGDHRVQGQRGARDAICVHGEGYGTVSSTIILYRKDEQRFYYYHAGGAPCRSEFREMSPVRVTL